jgi:hypothetical protein
MRTSDAANLRGANIRESLLDEINLNRADLSGTDITGSVFWGVATSGWRIDGIRAEYVYFCSTTEENRERYRRTFSEGQFEALFKSLPTLELVFQEGLNPVDLIALNSLIAQIAQQNPGLKVRMANIHKSDFETKIGITAAKDEYLEDLGRLVKDALGEALKGMSWEVIIPVLSKMLPANLGEALARESHKEPVSWMFNFQPTINICEDRWLHRRYLSGRGNKW